MRRKTTSLTLWSPVLSLVLSLTVGCSLMLSSENPPCRDSLDCPAGWICDQEVFHCVPGDTPDSIVDLELSPPAASTSAPTQIPGLDLDDPRMNPERLELELSAGLTLVGHIGSPMGVPGSLVAKRKAEFGGRSLSWNITVDAAGYFEAFISQGDFEVLFRPTNRVDFPQLRLQGLTLGADESNHSMDLVYPSYPAQLDLESQERILLIRVQVLQSEAAPHPIAGIQIEGTTESGLRTNLANPDAQGYAYLRLPVEIRSDLGDKIIYPSSLSLSLGPAATGAHLPQVQTDFVELSEADLGVIYVGELPGSHAVSGAVTDDRGNAVPDCQLRFQTDLGNGRFSHTIATDSQGAFSTTLPEGRFLLTAIPGNQRPEGIQTTEFVVDGVKSGVAVILDPRFLLSGTVLDSKGQPVAEVDVIAERVADWTGSDDGIQRSYESMSAADGSFELPVDAGSYEFSLLPPTASGLPRKPAEHLFVYDDLALDATKTRLREPAVLQGHVFSRAGVPQCGVGIKIFRRVEDAAVLVGQGISATSDQEGCSGTFAIVIPAQ